MLSSAPAEDILKRLQHTIMMGNLFTFISEGSKKNILQTNILSARHLFCPHKTIIRDVIVIHVNIPSILYCGVCFSYVENDY